jgi:hypothetical protein
MASVNQAQFHLERERHCRMMAAKAADRWIRLLHNQLADRHAALAALESSRRDSPTEGSPVSPTPASERLARQAMSQNPLARLH